MKKKLLLLILLTITIHTGVIAKTTYVPTYYTQINIEGGDVMLSDSTVRRELSMMASDGRYAITVLHDSVTAERVKAIKSMKAAAGWATAASVMYGVSASLNPIRTSWDAVNYMSSLHSMASTSMMHIAAKQSANSLEKVPVTIIIENLSEREMVINDMKRGLTWYVPAKNYIELNVGNPEVNKLRIAYSDCQDQKKDYVTIQAANYLDKQTIAYEDDDAWYFPVYKIYDELSIIPAKSADDVEYYEKVNKVTFEHEYLEIEEFKELKKMLKDAEKQKK